MRLGIVALALVSILALFGIAHALDLGSCPDGTQYGKCSTKNQGNYCTGTPPALQIYTLLCKCESVPGWITQGAGENAICVQAKCDDGTQMAFSPAQIGRAHV